MSETIKARSSSAYVKADSTDQKVVKNFSASTVYYGSETVSSTSNEGSLAPQGSLTLTQGKWFRASSGTMVLLVDGLGREDTTADLDRRVDALEGATVVPSDIGPPVNTVAPVASGTPVSGQMLTCSTGTWTGATPISYSYQWKRDGVVIPGQTGNTYLLDAATDEGADILCTVTATNAAGTASHDSNTVVPTAPPVTYLLRDQFTSDEAAPPATPRTCEPGPGSLVLTATATATPSISGGKYLRPKASANQGYPNYGAASPSGLTRECGLAAYAVAQFATLDRVAPVSFRGQATLDLGDIALVVGTSAVQFIDSGGSVNVAPALAADTDYQFAIVARGNGFLYLIRGGTYTDWTLLYVGAKDTQPLLYPMSANYNADSKHDEFAVLQKSGPLAQEFGKCVAMTPIPETGDTRVGAADGLTYLTWTPVAAETLSIFFRRISDNETYRLDCSQTGATIKLYRRTGGVDTELDAGKTQTFTAGTQYRIGIRYVAGAIRTFVAPAGAVTTAKHSVTGETFNLATTGEKVSGGAALANWELWPVTFAGTDFETLA